MLAAADKAGVQLGVVSQRRFYEPVRRMRAAIDAGKIGRPALGMFLMLSGATKPITAPTPGAAVVHGGRRRSCQPVAAPIGSFAMAHGAD